MPVRDGEGGSCHDDQEQRFGEAPEERRSGYLADGSAVAAHHEKDGALGALAPRQRKKTVRSAHSLMVEVASQGIVGTGTQNGPKRRASVELVAGPAEEGSR